MFFNASLFDVKGSRDSPRRRVMPAGLAVEEPGDDALRPPLEASGLRGDMVSGKARERYFGQVRAANGDNRCQAWGTNG